MGIYVFLYSLDGILVPHVFTQMFHPSFDDISNMASFIFCSEILQIINVYKCVYAHTPAYSMYTHTYKHAHKHTHHVCI